jgi:hypothetical protein
LTESVRQSRIEIVGNDLISSFSRELAGTSDTDRRALLIELAVANPFSPYWFEMTERREVCRVTALTLIAALSMGLEPDCVAIVDAAWRKLAKDLNTVALETPAGPLIALAMPATPGMTAATAMSAGLAQLGFGTIGTGGLGLVAGQWLLGVVGTAQAITTEAAITDVVASPGFGYLLELELYKLVLTVRLAEERRWFDAPIERAARAIEHVSGEVIAELESAMGRNDPKASRVRELRRLGATCLRAAAKIARLRERSTLSQQQPV